MSTERHERISALFLEARALAAGERAAFLAALEPDLREEVDSLLAHDLPEKELSATELDGAPARPAEEPTQEASEGEPARWDAGLEGEVSKLLEAARELDPFGAGLEEGSGEREHTIGDFRILRRLGAGGMAIVYEAEQVSLKRKVALKILPSHLRFAKDAIGKFQREAEAGGRQSHPGIVAIHALGEHAGVHYIAQELVPGGRTLSHELRRLREQDDLGSVHFRWAADLVAKVADALGHAHASGVVHRDVKPSNILLTADGEPKVADFGLAKVEDALALSRTGDLVGTPFYMSPEQTQSQKGELDHRTDVYSLGVTLYELVTLQRPFDGETSQAILEKILYQSARPPRSVGSQVPADLSTICLMAMEKEPTRRYQSMAAFAADLRRFVAGGPIRARPSGPILRATRWLRRNAVASVAAIATAVAVAAMVVMTLTLSREPGPAYAILPEALRIRDWRSLAPHLEARTSPLYLVDPDAPGHFVLHALVQLGTNMERVALTDLDKCLAACEQRGIRALACDLHYLKGVAYARLARAPDTAAERADELLRQAREEFAAAEEYEVAVGERLVRRHEDPSRHLASVKINLDHPFVALSRASVSFGRLFKGGMANDYQSTIQDLEYVLRQRPENLTAHTLLGRTLFFYARAHDRMELLDEAEENLRAVLDQAEQSGTHLVHTTLGQLLLLRGDHRAARGFLERAGELTRLGTEHVHNIHRALGKVCWLEGDPTRALEHYEQARALTTTDVKNKVALGEFHFGRGDTEEALHWSRQALSQNHPLSAGAPSDIAASYLLYSRLCLATGDQAAASRSLSTIYRETVLCPRDLSLAAQLVATLPEDVKFNAADFFADLNILSGINSPLCLSAMGVKERWGGDLRAAIEYFERAIRKRSEWPQDIREHRWADSTRDRYLLAMAQYELAGAREATHAQDWKTSYLQAEREVHEHAATLEYPDILARIRAKAKRVLPVAE